MGLDAVELVIEVEEEFEIKLDDASAEKMHTVGQLHDYIVSKLPANSPWATAQAGQTIATWPCLTAAAFYRLRAAVAEVTGQSAKRIRPGTTLDSQLPALQRRKLWKRVRHNLKLQLPRIGYSKVVERVIWLIAGLITLVGVAFFLRDGRQVPWFVGGFVAALVSLYIGFTPLAWSIEHVQTFGDAAKWVAIRDHATLSETIGVTTRETVWIRLVAIVSEQLGVDPLIIRPETSFVNDLGMD
jgi:acyl carrier protein